MSRLTVWLTLTCLWLAVLPARIAARLAAATRRRAGGDRGESPVTMAVIAVGMVAFAIIVVAILRAKGESAANNICVQADGTSCR
jgi:hypothetical protein